MKVVIDSNIFVSCMNPSSDKYIVFTKLVEGFYNLCITTDIAMEYLEVFQRKFASVKADNLFRFISESGFVTAVPVYFKWRLIKADPDDNKFVDCALAASADFIVTDDAHFNELSKIDFPQVKCVSLNEFVQMLR